MLDCKKVHTIDCNSTVYRSLVGGGGSISQDGGGFSNNPSISILNLGRPSVDKVAFQAGPGVTRITVNLKYM